MKLTDFSMWNKENFEGMAHGEKLLIIERVEGVHGGVYLHRVQGGWGIETYMPESEPVPLVRQFGVGSDLDLKDYVLRLQTLSS